jgi:putative ABC transport system permease protein
LLTYAVLLVAISKNLYLSLVVLASFVFGTSPIMAIAWALSKQLGKFIRNLPTAPRGLFFIGTTLRLEERNLL